MKKRGMVLVVLVLLINTISIVFGNTDFTIYKSLEIFCQDDAAKCEVRVYCPGFMGTNCHSEDEDCDDNDEFASIVTLPEQGCYIMASEKDGWPDFNDCGYGVAQEAETINDDLREINYFGNFVVFDDDGDARKILKKLIYTNKNHLICSDDHQWYECNANVQGGIVDIEISGTDPPSTKHYICLPTPDGKFDWKDTDEFDTTFDGDLDGVPDYFDCADNNDKIYPNFPLDCTVEKDAEGNEITDCIVPGPDPVCGDGIDNDCSIRPADPYDINDDCDTDQVACETNCLEPTEKCEWRDSADANKCCGDDGVGEIGQILRESGTGTNYLCLNKQNPAILSTPDGVIAWTGCEDTSKGCWLAASQDKFHTYTLTKPGEQPYDIVSNNQNWFACNRTTAAAGEGPLGINAPAAVSLADDIKAANGLYCVQQGNRWGWAQCGDYREPPINPNAKVVGDGPFALPVQNIVDNVVELKKPDGRFDIPANHDLEFRVRFTGSLESAARISFPADIQLFITGQQPNGDTIIYVNENVSSHAIGSPLLEIGRWMHIRVPLPEMMNINLIQLKASPPENHIEVTNVYVHPQDRVPPLCSGEGSATHDKTAWLNSVDFWDGTTYNAENLCNALYSPLYDPSVPATQTAWLGHTNVPPDKRCCGNTAGEYYAGPSEAHDDKFYGCWNSQPIASGDTVMNVEAVVESMTTRREFTYPEKDFTFKLIKVNRSYDEITELSEEESWRNMGLRGEPIPQVDSLAQIPPEDLDALYYVVSLGKFFKIREHRDVINYPPNTVSFSSSPLLVDQKIFNKKDFTMLDGQVFGSITVETLNDPSADNVNVYLLNPEEGIEHHVVVSPTDVGVYRRSTLDPKNLNPGKNTFYIMAQVRDNYQIDFTESEPRETTTTLKYTCTPDANTPDAEATTSCIYPLPGNPPYKITNPHTDLYELSFVSVDESGEEHSQPITNDPDQIFTVPGNLKATKVAQQVLFVSQEAPEVDTGFYGCQAADYLNEHASPAAGVENLPSCSIKAGKFCAPSILHTPSDDIKDRFTTINSWDTHVLRQIGYLHLTDPNQPDVNAFYASDTINLRDAREGETAATDRNYSSAVLPARNILSNPEFQTTVRELPHWQVLGADGIELAEERSAIQENTITIGERMLLRSERIAVPQNTDFHVSFTGTAAAQIILVDKEGTRETIIERDFSTGDASYLLLEFLPGTVSQPMLQNVDDKGPVDYYAVDSGLSEDATARAGVACCPQNYCWNGYACVEPMGKYTYLAEHIGEGWDYRCINGEWTYQPVKKDWQENQWGFCSSQEQCFVLSSLQGGDSEKAANDFYQSQYPSCINDGEYIFDNYCDKGNWTSRTKFLATKLLDVAGSEDYTLYCADYRTALNNYQLADDNLGGTTPQQLEEREDPLQSPAEARNTCFPLTNEGKLLVPTEHNTCVNNVCVLQQNGKTTFATSLNKDIHAPGSFLLALNVPESKLREACRGESNFVHCNAADLGIAGDLWYSPKLNAVIYSQDSISVTPTIIDKVVNFFRDLFTASSLSAEQEFVEKAQNFNDIYLVSQAGKKVRAIKEVFPNVKQTLIAEYENFNTPVCDYVNNIASPNQEQPLAAASGQHEFSCTQHEDVQRVEMLQQENIDFFWNKLTGQLRIG